MSGMKRKFWSIDVEKYINEVNVEEFSYLQGVTSSIQTQLDNKSSITHTHNLSEIDDVTASASEVNTLNGILVDVTELNYLDGVSSNIQTQLDNKSPTTHNHDTEYLGIDSVATDSDKLDGEDGTYYLNYTNFTNTPSIPSVINDLSNVNTTPTDGQVLKWDNTSSTWVASNPAGISTLDEIDNVVIDSIVDGEMLVWDNSTSKWINQTLSELGISEVGHTHTVSNISDLTATATELNYTSGVTSNIQTQLDGKSDTSHLHDDRYYTETEMNSFLADKSDTTHLHDDRYYTETETDNTFLALSGGNMTGNIDMGYGTLSSVAIIRGGNSLGLYPNSYDVTPAIRLYSGNGTTDGWLERLQVTGASATATIHILNSNLDLNGGNVLNVGTIGTGTYTLTIDETKALSDFVETLGDLGITVSSTEINYLDNASSNIQTQLNSKLEDITAESIEDLSNVVVTTGTSNDVLVYDEVSGDWENEQKNEFDSVEYKDDSGSVMYRVEYNETDGALDFMYVG